MANYQFFDAEYYLQQNPDVAVAWQGSALDHYIQFGAAEGRAPTAWFDAQYYRVNNPDLANMSALELFNHYCTYGFAEGRVPAAGFADFDAARYLADYPDLGANGVTESTALAHFLVYGENEGRVAFNEGTDDPITGGGSVGDTFTLTTGADNFFGTESNDTFNAPPVNIIGQDASTLQGFDVLEGNGGQDTLNIYVQNGGYNQSQVGTVKEIETVNIFNTEADGDNFGGSAGIDAAKFAGVTELWQIDGANDIKNLAETTIAGFRNEVGEDVNVTAAAGSESINIALEDVHNSYVGFNVAGGALNSLNITGAATYDGEDACGNPTVENAWASVDVTNSAGSKFSLNTEVNTNLYVGGVANVHEVDASASVASVDVYGAWGQLQKVTTGAGSDYVSSTGFVTSSAAAASYVTGDGDDGVSLNTSGTGATAVDTGAGDDWVDIYGVSKTATVTTGDGADEVWVNAGGLSQTSSLNVDLGAGDDTLGAYNVVMADVPAAYVFDGGDGNDVASLNVGASRVFNAGDYVTLTESLKNFETLELYGDYNVDVTVDASRLAGYSALTFVGEGYNDIVVQKASATQTVTLQDEGYWWSDSGMTLDITAAGYDASGATTAYGGDLTVVAAPDSWGEDYNGSYWSYNGYQTVTAKGNALDLTVDANATTWVSGDSDPDFQLYNTVYLHGDVKSATVTLESEVLNNGADCPDDLVEEGVVTAQLVVSASTTDLKALTSLTLDGSGEAYVTNNVGAKLVNVDASALTGIAWDATTNASVTGNGLSYWTDNAAAETIVLSGGYDDLVWNSVAASTYAKMDTASGLTLVADAVTGDLNVAKSDDISVAGITDFTKLTAEQAASVSAMASFNLAVQAVAQLGTDHAVFAYGGNTYVFADSANLAQLDDSDTVIKLTGTIDQTLLLDALNA